MPDPETVTLDPSDPYAREAQTFPHFGPEVIERLRAYGTPEHLAAGASLFARGDRNVDFFVVLEGAVEIFDSDSSGHVQVFTVHGAGQFTGELDLFNDRAILVSGRAGGDSRVLRIRRDDFRRLIAAEADIGETIVRAFILRRVGLVRHAQGGVMLVGSPHASDTQRLQRFMIRNNYPHRLVDTEADASAGGLLAEFGLSADDLPVVVTPDRRVLRNPTTPQLADDLGLTARIDPAHVYDVAVVGAGPAGLAAAVYAASEGLDTIVIEAAAPGGQAGTSSKIENYLGFPTGISGAALAGRAQTQAQKFGARFAITRAAVGLDCASQPFRLQLDDGQTVASAAVVVATGARYQKLDVPRYADFEGRGIHYAATAMEAQLCAGEEVIVIGGGNSAGQAAIFLSRHVAHLHILVRGRGLADTMSDYLIQRITSSPRITLHTHTEITAFDGSAYLEHVTWTERRNGQSETRRIRNIFVMIGAQPATEWLNGCLVLDDRGFITTGVSEAGAALPSPYATTKPGIFAVGDVRSGSIKRVASGVGEGSVVVSAIHQFLHRQS